MIEIQYLTPDDWSLWRELRLEASPSRRTRSARRSRTGAAPATPSNAGGRA